MFAMTFNNAKLQSHVVHRSGLIFHCCQSFETSLLFSTENYGLNEGACLKIRAAPKITCSFHCGQFPIEITISNGIFVWSTSSYHMTCLNVVSENTFLGIHE